ncbi:MAG TPA: hypothetical protein VGC63_05015 [Solirubrobacterales bacterium]|jgi:hypothetical protein
MATGKKPPRCTGKSKATGKRCKAPPLKGTKRCGAHPLDPDSPRFGSPEQAGEAGKLGGRPRLPRPHEEMRRRIEEDIERYLAPIEAALGAGKPIKTWNTAEGAHEIVYVDDPELGMKALKLVLSYVYGKPRQPLELAGEDGGPVKTELDFSDPTVREALHGLVSAVADAREG